MSRDAHVCDHSGAAFPDSYRRCLAEHLSPLADRAQHSAVVPLATAAQRVLADSFYATADMPLFVNSQMDGYAVHAADIALASHAVPVELPVVRTIAAGMSPGRAVAAGTAVKIMTGAALPEGVDCVVPVEDTTPTVDHRSVMVYQQREPGDFVRRPGDDVRAGDIVVEAGTQLSARHCAALASMGAAQIAVRPLPRVAVIATGSELVAPGHDVGPGQIFESNSLSLSIAAEEAGGEVTSVVTVSDSGELLATQLESASAVADLIITAGGVSMGDFEVVREVLEPQPESWFGHIAMQPGGPQGLASWRGVPVVCFPGNPVSALVSFVVLLRPILRAASGLADIPRLTVPLTVDIATPSGRVRYLRGRLDDKARSVSPVSGPGSHLVAAMARADVLIEVPAATENIRAGTAVQCLPL